MNNGLIQSKKHQIIDCNKFIYYDDKLNLVIKLKYFLKQKNYQYFIEHIFKTIDELILLRITKLNICTMDTYIDLKDHKLKEIDYDFIKMMIHVLQEKYPDNLKVIWVTNANIMVKTIYTIIRPFIDKETRQKIFFLKKNKKNKNKKVINESNLEELLE
tara:strand:- start:952 stop:1428 length:477 start_codon:yes stop_codon:yes gene_type:complete